MKKCVYFFLLITFSCTSQKRILESQLDECISRSINSKSLYKIDLSVKIDLNKIVLDTEEMLEAKEYLKDNKSKKEYLELFDKLYGGDIALLKELYSEISMIRESYNYNGEYIGNIVLQSCPHFIEEKNVDSISSLKKQVEALDRLYSSNPYDETLIKEVITSVTDKDFKQVTYRVPLYVLLAEYIENKLKK